jgi:acyl-homoserine-lactone acylase
MSFIRNRHFRLLCIFDCMKLLLLCCILPIAAWSQMFSPKEIARYKAEAQQVTIIRDNWGIAHVYGKTDADAVFGLLYAQCEESFEKVEDNNLEMLGRLAEAGKAGLYDDLLMRLIYDSAAAVADYRSCPSWFKKLLDASADGVNYFLYTHPGVKPQVLRRFEPWFALMRTNGSISATQTAEITNSDIRNLYPSDQPAVSSMKQYPPPTEQLETGSNGFAVGPSRTRSGHAILYINPHVTFYYRSEMHMVSDEGLNAYGAVTWGTFFIFQGFNEHCGWMHTTSYADAADLYREKIERRGDSVFYLYDGKWLAALQKSITIRFRHDTLAGKRTFATYKTVHGPVMGMRNGDWLSLKENNRSLEGLLQSWLRTKAKGFDDFKRNMERRSNTSDNTVFADDKGNIAFWYGNFFPRRDEKYDWAKPVDGTTSASEWKGIYELDELIHVYNPATGWIQNCNSTPFTVSGSSSPRREDYPANMAPTPENYRAINARHLLDEKKDLTIDRMISEIGYSHYLSAFDVLLPPLFPAYDSLASSDPQRSLLAEPIALLRGWDKNSGVSSVATTIATEWATALGRNVTRQQPLQALASALAELQQRYGSWKIPWGDINRYQRVGIGDTFDDKKSSLASGLASSTFGSLPSFQTRRIAGNQKRYGYSGNSFVACVEFGEKVRAKSITTGGQSFDPASKHFIDQAPGYLKGEFKDVLFYREDVMKHVEREYHPGQ